MAKEGERDSDIGHLRHAVHGYRQSRKLFASALGFGPDASDDQLIERIEALVARPRPEPEVPL